MYAYRDKGLFLQRLHPATVLLYISTLLFLTVVYSNPLFLLSLLLVIAYTANELDGWEDLKSYGRFGLMMFIFIIIINPLLSREGQTILWHGPQVPGLGVIEVSLEAVLYGLNMGLRMFVFMTVFCLYNLMMDPDKAMTMFARVAQKSTLALALTIRLIPAMSTRAKSVGEIQRSRGVNLDTGRRLQRWRNRLPFLKVMLLSSLEDSWQIAEAMEARGFGSGHRTQYIRGGWRPRDVWIITGIIMTGLVVVPSLVAGVGTYDFYPRLGKLLTHRDLLVLILLTLTLALPSVLSKGCKKWNFLRQKI